MCQRGLKLAMKCLYLGQNSVTITRQHLQCLPIFTKIGQKLLCRISLCWKCSHLDTTYCVNKSAYPVSRKACILGLLRSMFRKLSGIILNMLRYFSNLFKASNWLNFAILRNLSKNDASVRMHKVYIDKLILRSHVAKLHCYAIVLFLLSS